jgi:SagB-type dehydrogenase family enzyme
MSLTQAITGRRSHRAFTPRVLSADELSGLCWSAQGITDEMTGYRAAPSAKALFPMTLYVAGTGGVHVYLPAEHALRPTIDHDIRRQLQAATFDQDCVGTAPSCFIITMDESVFGVEPDDRTRSACLLEAGHIAQNILLMATALGLGGVPVGAFDEDEIATLLGFPAGHRLAYIVPVGEPTD